MIVKVMSVVKVVLDHWSLKCQKGMKKMPYCKQRRRTCVQQQPAGRGKVSSRDQIKFHKLLSQISCPGLRYLKASEDHQVRRVPWANQLQKKA